MLLTLIDENVLLRLHIGGRNVLLFAGILTGCVGFARSQAKEGARMEMTEAGGILLALKRHIHVPSPAGEATEAAKQRLRLGYGHQPQQRRYRLPSLLPSIDSSENLSWLEQGRGGRESAVLAPSDVSGSYSIVSAFFPNRVFAYMYEVLGAVTLPLALLFVFPRQADALVSFVRTYTSYLEADGPVVAFSDFEAQEALRMQQEKAEKAGDQYGSLLYSSTVNIAAADGTRRRARTQTAADRISDPAAFVGLPPNAMGASFLVPSHQWSNKVNESMLVFNRNHS